MAPQGREQEIVGGLKNALERGIDIMTAQQSFVNAGYTPAEVATAAQIAVQGAQPGMPAASPGAAPAQATPTATPNAMPAASPGAAPAQATPATVPAQANNSGSQFPGSPPKKASKAWIWGLIIASIVLIGGAVALWLFWDRLF